MREKQELAATSIYEFQSIHDENDDDNDEKDENNIQDTRHKIQNCTTTIIITTMAMKIAHNTQNKHDNKYPMTLYNSSQKCLNITFEVK